MASLKAYVTNRLLAEIGITLLSITENAIYPPTQPPEAEAAVTPNVFREDNSWLLSLGFKSSKEVTCPLI